MVLGGIADPVGDADRCAADRTGEVVVLKADHAVAVEVVIVEMDRELDVAEEVIVVAIVVGELELVIVKHMRELPAISDEVEEERGQGVGVGVDAPAEFLVVVVNGPPVLPLGSTGEVENAFFDDPRLVEEGLVGRGGKETCDKGCVIGSDLLRFGEVPLSADSIVAAGPESGAEKRECLGLDLVESLVLVGLVSGRCGRAVRIGFIDEVAVLVEFSDHADQIVSALGGFDKRLAAVVEAVKGGVADAVLDGDPAADAKGVAGDSVASVARIVEGGLCAVVVEGGDETVVKRVGDLSCGDTAAGDLGERDFVVVDRGVETPGGPSREPGRRFVRVSRPRRSHFSIS